MIWANVTKFKLKLYCPCQFFSAGTPMFTTIIRTNILRSKYNPGAMKRKPQTPSHYHYLTISSFQKNYKITKTTIHNIHSFIRTNITPLMISLELTDHYFYKVSYTQ